MKKFLLILSFLVLWNWIGITYAQTPAPVPPSNSCKTNGLTFLCNDLIQVWGGTGFNIAGKTPNAILTGMGYGYALTWERNGKDQCDFLGPVSGVGATISGTAVSKLGYGLIILSCSPPSSSRLAVQLSIIKMPGVPSLFLVPNLGIGF